MSPIPTSWILGGAGIAIAASLAWGGVQRYDLRKAEKATATLQAAWNEERITLLTAAVTATAKNRDDEQRWKDQQTEALNVAQKVTDQARADAADLRGTLDRLRQRDAARTTGSCPATPGAGTASPGAPASAPPPLPADVLSRTAEAAAELAEFADRAVIAGQACEAAWPR